MAAEMMETEAFEGLYDGVPPCKQKEEEASFFFSPKKERINEPMRPFAFASENTSNAGLFLDADLQKAKHLSMMEKINFQGVVNEQMEADVVIHKTGNEHFGEVNKSLQVQLVTLERQVREQTTEHKKLDEEATRLQREIESLRGSNAVVNFEKKLRLKDEVIEELKAERSMLEEAFDVQQEMQKELEDETRKREEMQQKHDALFRTFEELKAHEEESEVVKNESAVLKQRLAQRDLVSNGAPNLAVNALTDLIQSSSKLFSEENADEASEGGEIAQLKVQIATLSRQMTDLIVDTREIKEKLACKEAVGEREERKKALQEQIQEQMHHIERLTLTLQGSQPNRFLDYSKNFVALALIIILML